MHTTEVIDNT